MRELQPDHLPYFCSFASGCAGFISLLVVAGGASNASPERGPTICVMADCIPRGVPYNMLQERILGSDHSSAFLVGHAEVGYQLLGVELLLDHTARRVIRRDCKTGCQTDSTAYDTP
jgi:hypothetical protein